MARAGLMPFYLVTRDADGLIVQGRRSSAPAPDTSLPAGTTEHEVSFEVFAQSKTRFEGDPNTPRWLWDYGLGELVEQTDMRPWLRFSTGGQVEAGGTNQGGKLIRLMTGDTPVVLSTKAYNRNMVPITVDAIRRADVIVDQLPVEKVFVFVGGEGTFDVTTTRAYHAELTHCPEFRVVGGPIRIVVGSDELP
jgi:hypothetical protein